MTENVEKNELRFVANTVRSSESTYNLYGKANFFCVPPSHSYFIFATETFNRIVDIGNHPNKSRLFLVGHAEVLTLCPTYYLFIIEAGNKQRHPKRS